MPELSIIGENLPHMPWEERPKGSPELVWRSTRNPITGWEPIPSGARAFNSAVVPFAGEFAGVFRVDHKDGRPHLHAGKSRDALHWEIEHEPIVWVDEDGSDVTPAFAYDPRVVKIDDVYYITWCTDFNGYSIGVGKTRDFKQFIKLENAFVPYNRNGVLFPRKINGLFVMLNRPSDTGHTPFGDIYLSRSPDMCFWGMHRHVMSRGVSGWWQGTKIGAGPAPIETSAGWLLFYHGVANTCNGFVYSMGAAILDIDEPWQVLYRCRDYLLTPREPYETTGFVPNVVFPCATLHDARTGRIAVYYGAADTYTAVAYCRVDEVIEYIKHNSLTAG